MRGGWQEVEQAAVRVHGWRLVWWSVRSYTEESSCYRHCKLPVSNAKEIKQTGGRGGWEQVGTVSLSVSAYRRETQQLSHKTGSIASFIWPNFKSDTAATWMCGCMCVCVCVCVCTCTADRHKDEQMNKVVKCVSARHYCECQQVYFPRIHSQQS